MKSIRCTTLILGSCLAAIAHAQSPPGDFDQVVNFPHPVIGSILGPGDGVSIGSSSRSTQYNMNPGSVGGNDVSKLAGFLELNMLGGQFGDRLTLTGDSRLNLISGSIGHALFSEGEVNVMSGQIGNGLTLSGSSQLNLISGSIGNNLSSSGEVNFRGGRIGTGFTVDGASQLNITGSDFHLNGAPIAFGAQNFSDAPFLLSGILEDGTPFAFTDAQGDMLRSIALIDAGHSAPDTAPLAINTASTLAALRPGQNVTLNTGGSLPNNGAVLQATLHITGGNLGAGSEIVDSTVSMSAGSIGGGSGLLGSATVTATGGTIQNGTRIYRDARLNLSDQAAAEATILFEGGTLSISGGSLQVATLNPGATLNIEGGTSQSISARSGGIINYSAGAIGSLDLGGGAVLNVNGGVFAPAGSSFFPSINTGTTINVHAGILGANVKSRSGVVINVLGGAIADNASAFGGQINLHSGSIGQNFQLSQATLNVQDGIVGGNLQIDFGATANISAGEVQGDVRVEGTLNLTGGSIASLSLDRGEANISGGALPQFLNAGNGSTLNLIGREFILDDFVRFELLEPNRPFEITARNGILSGILADGSPFSLNLTSIFSSEATLNIIRADDTLPGDYNADGIVDAADYTDWRDNFGSGAALSNDDTPGVGPDDYTRWKSYFGQAAGAASFDEVIVPVPETTTLILSLLGLALVHAAGRKR